MSVSLFVRMEKQLKYDLFVTFARKQFALDNVFTYPWQQSTESQSHEKTLVSEYYIHVRLQRETEKQHSCITSLAYC